MIKKIDAIDEARRSPRRPGLVERFLKAEGGVVAVIAAVAFPVLVGAMGRYAQSLRSRAARRPACLPCRPPHPAKTVTGSTDVRLSGCSLVSNSSAADAMKNGSALTSVSFCGRGRNPTLSAASDLTRQASARSITLGKSGNGLADVTTTTTTTTTTTYVCTALNPAGNVNDDHSTTQTTTSTETETGVQVCFNSPNAIDPAGPLCTQ